MYGISEQNVLDISVLDIRDRLLLLVIGTAITSKMPAAISQIQTTGDGGSAGIAFAIPIDLVKGEVGRLERG